MEKCDYAVSVEGMKGSKAGRGSLEATQEQVAWELKNGGLDSGGAENLRWMTWGLDRGSAEYLRRMAHGQYTGQARNF